MKIAGLIGGIGPESTIDYYRSILATYRERVGRDEAPALVINSVDVQTLLRMMTAGRLDDVVEYLAPEIARLAQAGADFAVLTANSPHLVFDELRRRSPIPMISIVEVTAAHAKARGLSRLALLGTRFTMKARFYPDVCRAAGIEIVTPDAGERARIHEIYIGELLKGEFRPEARAEILAIISKLAARDGIDGVVLGGTELPLLLREPDHHGVPFLDTTAIHVAAIVDALLDVGQP